MLLFEAQENRGTHRHCFSRCGVRLSNVGSSMSAKSMLDLVSTTSTTKSASTSNEWRPISQLYSSPHYSQRILSSPGPFECMLLAAQVAATRWQCVCVGDGVIDPCAMCIPKIDTHLLAYMSRVEMPLACLRDTDYCARCRREMPLIVCTTSPRIY